eukprot:s4881_g2.t4
MDDGPPNVEIRPFREADRPWLIIEAHAFSSGEQCLDMWLRDATAEGSRTSVDVVVQGASGCVLGYCAYRFEGTVQSICNFIDFNLAS